VMESMKAGYVYALIIKQRSYSAQE